MNIGSVGTAGSAGTSLSLDAVQQEAQVAILKKGLDAEQQAALKLLQALPEPHLGRRVDMTV